MQFSSFAYDFLFFNIRSLLHQAGYKQNHVVHKGLYRFLAEEH